MEYKYYNSVPHSWAENRSVKVNLGVTKLLHQTQQRAQALENRSDLAAQHEQQLKTARVKPEHNMPGEEVQHSTFMRSGI